ncbi:unnamed protein product [Larinioides sclopetarius]|uniref:Uncharacterized protein n=1 Tax=Larinioides sclopetarius TaxID=280406 RepID=A0AAV1ZJB8_9ARAC
MNKTISSVEKFRQEFYDCLKKEDIDYVNARSKKVTVDLYRRKESTDNPWLHCFYFNDNESKQFSHKSSVCSAADEKTQISFSSAITDEEINDCKDALRREAHSKKLPDLASKPDELRLLFLEYREEFPKNFKKQRKLFGEIVSNMMNFEVDLKDGLDVLKSLNEIAITADTTVDTATANITEMRRMMQDFQTITDLVSENLRKVIEKFERYQELDGKMDRDIFRFLAHFFPNFLVPRIMRKRNNTRL